MYAADHTSTLLPATKAAAFTRRAVCDIDSPNTNSPPNNGVTGRLTASHGVDMLVLTCRTRQRSRPR